MALRILIHAAAFIGVSILLAVLALSWVVRHMGRMERHDRHRTQV